VPASEQSLRALGRQAGLEEVLIDELWVTLAGRYGEAHRAYHDLAHVGNMLDHLERCREIEGRDVLAWAIWFHDVVYDPQSSSNEADSATLFRELLGRAFDTAFVTEVERLIMVTDPGADRPADMAGKLIADLDLLTLGADRADYEAYARAIRQEYAFVPAEDFARGRVAVMEGFLALDRIYNTPDFTHLEAPARANIQAEVAQLRDEMN
jgi:predicted metal-dependent HD superfamily phosphohydrolase